jgi:hypothetical protein
MEWLTQAAVITGFFLVRLGVPLAITLTVAYWLRSVDAKWQAEAQARWETAQPENEPAAERETKGGEVAGNPCWDLKGCPQSARTRCPAYRRPEVPCWLARCRAEGRLPASCAHCALFMPRERSPGWAA